MPTPPRAKQRPHQIERHGDVRVDPYHWLRDREDDEGLTLLREENDYLAAGLASLEGLRERLYAEIRRRIDETDISVPVRRGSWWYFERTREGLDYPVSCRVPAAPDEPPPPVDAQSSLEGEVVILDENAEARGHDYFSVGVFEISLDDQWLALATDVAGDELHQLCFRPLAGQAPADETIDDVFYGATWSGDSRTFFYTRVDEAMRPHQIWRHTLGTPASADVLVYEESDPQFTVSIGRSRDHDVIVIVSSSSTSSESRWLPADDPTGDLRLGEPRRSGIEYGLEHAVDASGQRWWLKLTNEDATDFRLLVGPSATGPWRELVGHRPGTRLDGVEAFARHLVLAERLEGSSAVRVIPLPAEDPWGGDLLARSWLVEGPEQPSTVGVGANPNYETSSLRIGLTSLVTPYLVADVDLASGEMVVRKQQRVRGGYDAAAYATGRLWVTASASRSRGSRGATCLRSATGRWLPGPPHRSCSTATAATRSPSTRRSPRFASPCWIAASSSPSPTSAAAARWAAPGTRWAAWPRSPRPSATSSRSPATWWRPGGPRRSRWLRGVARPVDCSWAR